MVNSRHKPLQVRAAACVAICLFTSTPLIAAAAAYPGRSSQSVEPLKVIEQTAENGGRVDDVIASCSFFQEITVNDVGVGNIIRSQYHALSKLYSDRFGREERVLEVKSSFPVDEPISIGALKRLLPIYLFILDPQKLREYSFNYVGRENVDEVSAYVFDVAPKHKTSEHFTFGDQRRFDGRIWIDDRDFQVVKVSGEISPHSNPERTPRFETYFKVVEGVWLPSYVSADDDLPMGDDQLRVLIKVRRYGFALGQPKRPQSD